MHHQEKIIRLTDVTVVYFRVYDQCLNPPARPTTFCFDKCFTLVNVCAVIKKKAPSNQCVKTTGGTKGQESCVRYFCVHADDDTEAVTLPRCYQDNLTVKFVITINTKQEVEMTLVREV